MNQLNLNLVGKTVLLEGARAPFVCKAGQGADPSLPGRTLVGYYVGSSRTEYVSSDLVTQVLDVKPASLFPPAAPKERVV